MLQQLRTSAVLLLSLTVLCGAIYPLTVTAIAQVAFPRQANGSMLFEGERKIGSELIGQAFSKPEHFWGRLSATTPMPYNAAASSGSNYGPLHPSIKKAAQKRIAALHGSGVQPGRIPIDVVTASASGLDPHISPAAAELQVPRVAASRKMDEAIVRELVRQHTAGRQLGVLGEPRVNVLKLNRTLDREHQE